MTVPRGNRDGEYLSPRRARNLFLALYRPQQAQVFYGAQFFEKCIRDWQREQRRQRCAAWQRQQRPRQRMRVKQLFV